MRICTVSASFSMRVGYVVGFGGNLMLSPQEGTESIPLYVADCNAVLLSDCGAMTRDRDLWKAFDQLETAEQTAKIYVRLQQLGDGVDLPKEQTRQLLSPSDSRK